MSAKDREYRPIEAQIRDKDLDLSYWPESEVFNIEWKTDADIENIAQLTYIFNNERYYNAGREVITVSQADEAWMKNTVDGSMNRYLKYDESRGIASASAKAGDVTDIVEIVGTLEGWDDLQDERDELWRQLNEEAEP